MKVAVTSQNFRTVTSHAGKARRFIVFDCQDGLDPFETERFDLPKDMSLSAYKGNDHPVFGADVVLSTSFGMGFVKRLQKHGVTASLVTAEAPLDAIMEYKTQGQKLPTEPSEGDIKKANGEHKKGSGCGCGHKKASPVQLLKRIMKSKKT